MKAKGIVTAVLLLFVVVSLAWFGTKEVLHSKAVKAAQDQRAASTVAEAPSLAVQMPAVVVPLPIATAPARNVPKEAATPAPMKPKAEPAGLAPSAKVLASSDGSKIVVYYLHTTARCPSCLKIEAYTAAEVTGPLAGPLSEGRLEWKVLNVDEPNNAHFVQDYQLYTKSVVVSEMKDGKEVRWKRLDKVWDYLGDQQAFMKYVDDEVRAYLKDVS